MKTKFHLAPAILFFLLLVTCAVHAQESTLTGHIEGIGKQPIMFWYDVDGVQQKDTVYANDDRFTYLPQPSDDGTIALFVSFPRWTRFWYEPGQITVTGNAKTPSQLTFRGTPENEIFDQYQQEVNWKKFDKKHNKTSTLQFIRDHSASRTATYLLYNTLSAAEEDNEIYQELWSALSPAMQTSFFGQKAAEKIKVLKTQPIVGRIAPNFTISDTAGIDVSLADFEGKYVLLDFWGHWCAPCIQAFPKVKAIHEKYGDKLEMIGIALENKGDKDSWLNAIHKYGANWTQLSDLKGEASETKREYNIVGYPTYILLDKEGVVLERASGSGLDDIERKLAALNDF